MNPYSTWILLLKSLVNRNWFLWRDAHRPDSLSSWWSLGFLNMAKHAFKEWCCTTRKFRNKIEIWRKSPSIVRKKAEFLSVLLNRYSMEFHDQIDFILLTNEKPSVKVQSDDWVFNKIRLFSHPARKSSRKQDKSNSLKRNIITLIL